MDIQIPNNQLRAALEADDKCRRKFGTDMSRKIRLRMDALLAAANLADFWPPRSGPERCHELGGDLKGVFSVDLKHPFRLLFRPTTARPEPSAGERPQTTDDGAEQQWWTQITSIEIIGIEDTHG